MALRSGRLALALWIALSLFGVKPLAAQTLSPQQVATIDASARAALASTGVPAASIAVVRNGKIVFAKAYGEQRPGQPARTDAPYAIASVSKQFTAAAVLMLADQGKLSLDDTIGRYLPELTQAKDVTIRQLLTHTAGLRDWWPQDYVFDDMTRPTTPAAILDRWAKAPLDFAPGTRFQYSNTGYVAAGLIVERVSRQPLFAFLRDHIFDRLGLHPTDADAGLPATAPQGYNRFGLGPVRPARPIASGWVFGSAELVMTAGDLARWDISVIDRTLMSPAAYDAQQREQILANGLGTDYGLGVDIDAVQGHRRVKHSGGYSGFFSENRIYPDDHAAIVVLDNADFGDAETVIADAIEQQLFANDSGVGRAGALYTMLRSGTLDRGRFTAHGNAYLTAMALADLQSSIQPLGEPKTITQTQSGLRGGLTIERFVLDFGSRKLQLTVRAEPGPQGRIEEAMVSPLS